MKNKSLILFLLLFCITSIVACDDESQDSQQIVDDSTPPRFISDPTIELDPNGNTPLAAELKLETDEPVFVTVNIFENNELAQVANET